MDPALLGGDEAFRLRGATPSPAICCVLTRCQAVGEALHGQRLTESLAQYFLACSHRRPILHMGKLSLRVSVVFKARWLREGRARALNPGLGVWLCFSPPPQISSLESCSETFLSA